MNNWRHHEVPKPFAIICWKIYYFVPFGGWHKLHRMDMCWLFSLDTQCQKIFEIYCSDFGWYAIRNRERLRSILLRLSTWNIDLSVCVTSKNFNPIKIRLDMQPNRIICAVCSFVGHLHCNDDNSNTISKQKYYRHNVGTSIYRYRWRRITNKNRCQNCGRTFNCNAAVYPYPTSNIRCRYIFGKNS